MPLALPDLGLVAAVIALLLIAGALWVLSRVLGGAFGFVPVVGGWVKAHIESALNDARNAVLRAAGATWRAAVHLFDWAADVFSRMFGALISGFGDVAATIDWIARHQVPGVLQSAYGRAAEVLGDAYGRAQSLFDVAERDIRAAEAAAISRAEGYYADARAYAAAVTADALRTAESGIRAAESVAAAATARLAADVAAADRQLSADITAGVRTAEATAISTAEGYARVIYTDIDNWGTQALDRVWPDADQDIAGLRRALGGSFPDINDLLGALGGLGAAGLAGALIRTMAGTAAMTRLAEDCVVPNCRNLSQFGRDLQGLLGDLPAAAMLAWFIFLVTDPGGWAQDTYDLGGPLSRTFTASAADLLGQH